MMHAAPIGLLLALASASPTPWHARPECLAAHAEVMRQDLPRAESAIAELDRSRDLGLKVCALWLRIPLSEAEQVLHGKGEDLFRRRERRLRTLYGFVRKYGGRHPDMVDVAIESRMRRAQLLAQTGEKMDSLSEARGVERMLDQRGDAPDTAPRSYVRGAIDLSVGEASWGMRTLLSMAGIDGDADRGRRTLERLAVEPSVYATQSLLLLYHMARQADGRTSARSLRYGAQLVALHPDSPQLVYDHARDLEKADRCQDALRVLQGVTDRLENEPHLYSRRVRRRIYRLAAKCAEAEGHLGDGHAWAALAAKQS